VDDFVAAAWSTLEFVWRLAIIALPIAIVVIVIVVGRTRNARSIQEGKAEIEVRNVPPPSAMSRGL